MSITRNPCFIPIHVVRHTHTLLRSPLVIVPVVRGGDHDPDPGLELLQLLQVLAGRLPPGRVVGEARLRDPAILVLKGRLLIRLKRNISVEICPVSFHVTSVNGPSNN